MNYEKESELLKALGHPIRLKIVAGLLLANDCNVSAMVEKLGIPQSTASQHLAILKSRGILAPRKNGVKTCYQVIDPRIRKIIAILSKNDESKGEN